MVRCQQIDCVMPAAGLSSRMGSWKMMLPYLHHTILDESIENALGFCSRVILVVGHRGEELVRRYESSGRVDVIVNQDFSLGMFSSIQQGVRHVSTDNFFISHGDMPCISPEIYHAVWMIRGEHTVFPGTQQQPGHPVLLSSSLIDAITTAPTNSKMKSLIKLGKVKYAGITESEILLDVDTKEAYKALCQR